MGKNDFYSRTTSLDSFYTGSTSGTEPDMRQELINTLDGLFPEVAKAQPALLRRIKRDNDNKLIPCNCVDKVTNEPDKDRFCQICFGEGYLWQEKNLQIYRVLKDSDTDNSLKNTFHEPGLINMALVVFYIRYDSEITKDDKIVRLVLDKEGNVISPYKRQAIYRVNTAWDFRSDNGKLEYWKVFTHQEDVKYLNSPLYKDI